MQILQDVLLNGQELLLLAVHFAGISAGSPVGFDHTMAGDDQRIRIFAQGLADRTCSLGPAYFPGDPLIGPGLS